jgi:hypothetical protein
MSQIWYEAVCETHKERCPIFRAVGIHDVLFPAYKSEDASAFLQLHYGCELYLIWRDDQLDKCNENQIFRIQDMEICPMCKEIIKEKGRADYQHKMWCKKCTEEHDKIEWG